MPVDGKTATTGAVIENGKYKSDAPLGESKVEIRVPKVVGKKKLYDTPIVRTGSSRGSASRQIQRSHRNYVLSRRGKNEKNWDLSSK